MSPNVFRRFFLSLVLIGLVIGVGVGKHKKEKVVYSVQAAPNPTKSAPIATPTPQPSNIIYRYTDTFIGDIPQFSSAFTMYLRIDCGPNPDAGLKTFYMNINGDNYTETITNGTLTFSRPYGTYNIHIANSCGANVVVVRN